MYLDYWGMQSRPFDNTHRPEYFVPVESATLALTKLRYAVASDVGGALLIGPAGIGKTEIARLVLDEQSHCGLNVAYLPDPSGSIEGLQSLLASLLGAAHDTERSPLERLMRRLAEIGEAGGGACVVVDDVHTVRDDALLESLRMLMNVEYQGRSLLHLVLSGQEDSLQDRLRHASGFFGRFALCVRLQPMSLEDTKNYILYRLKASGCQRGIFTRQAAQRVHELTLGVPREVNRLCDLCLLTGLGLQQKKIGPDLVETVACDLGIEEDVMAAVDGGACRACPPPADILASLPA